MDIITPIQCITACMDTIIGTTIIMVFLIIMEILGFMRIQGFMEIQAYTVQTRIIRIIFIIQKIGIMLILAAQVEIMLVDRV